MSPDTARSEAVRTAVESGFPLALADLGRLVRTPGVAWPSFDQSRLEESAAQVAALLTETGVFDTVEIARAAIAGTSELGQPAVLARRPARNGRPTVLLYAHHDVQPPGDDELWTSPPFEPTVRDGRLYGRGAADDKAGVMMHVAAIRALRDALGNDLDLGLSVFIEGEEEFGSRSFSSFLADHTDALRADVIVVADSGNWDERTPGLTVSLRGNVVMTLTVRTLEHASHSGMYGGAVPDAMTATILLLSSLWGADGSVAVTGMRERDAPSPDYPEKTLRADTGLLDGVRTIGADHLHRIWNAPAITVTGIDAPTVATASNTLAPEVSVVISARVAPGQPAAEAAAALEEHLRAHAPFGAQLDVAQVDVGEPFLADTTGWAATLARDALEAGYGAAPVDLGIGGSIPFIADLVREFPDAQILVTGIEDPHTRAHSPDESLHLDTFRHAITSEAFLLEAINQRAESGGGA